MSGRILALIPARSGSKSIPHKNVASIRGRPLLSYAIEQAKRSRLIDRVIVSTDSPSYAAIAEQWGAEVPFLRPAAIAGDLSTDLEVFLHALNLLRDADELPEVCVHLRPTYPNRTPAQIDAAISLLLDHPDIDSVRSITPARQTPYKMWLRSDDGLLRPFTEGPYPESYNLPRQLLPTVHVQNAAIDVVRTQVILARRSMTGDRILGYLMDEDLDIDTRRDLAASVAALPLDGAVTGKTFVFDIDGVIATLSGENDYTACAPIAQTIDIVNALHDAGARIVLFTARGSVTGIDWVERTREQLGRWGVHYDELRFGKPAGDYYVDDRQLRLDELESWFGTLDRRERD